MEKFAGGTPGGFSQLSALRQAEFLIGHEHESGNLVDVHLGEVLLELRLRLRKGPLASREVHSCHVCFSVTRACDIYATIRAAEGVAWVDVLEPLCVQYLCRKALGMRR
ncbi:MAG: hypothetical protein ACLGIR_04445 [Actinomycetes bacterium]